jgi:hypothetical protein
LQKIPTPAVGYLYTSAQRAASDCFFEFLPRLFQGALLEMRLSWHYLGRKAVRAMDLTPVGAKP